MKILLLNPISASKMPIVIPNLGLGYLASALRNRGHSVSILDCNKEQLTMKDISVCLREKSYRLIGIQVYSCDISTAKRTVEIIKQITPETTIVVGGPHPTALPEQSLTFLGADFSIAGEALYGLPDLADWLEGGNGNPPEEIEGLVYERDSRIVAHPRGYIKSMDDLSLPAWDLMDPRTYPPAPFGAFARAFPTAPLIVSRGCQYDCTFCAGKIMTGAGIRYRSIESVTEEILLLRERYGVRELHLIDDNFTGSRSYVRKFCKMMLGLDPPMSWSCPNGIRLDALNEEIVRLMRESGCYSVLVGIESGTQRILDHMRKKITLEKIVEKVDLLVEAGIKVTGSFILGYPEENLDDIKRTVRFAKSLRIQRADFNNFVPHPGTPIYYELKERGELRDEDWGAFLPYSVAYSPPGISRKQLKNIQRMAFISFSIRPGIAMGMLAELRSPRHFLCVLGRVLDIFKRR